MLNEIKSSQSSADTLPGLQELKLSCAYVTMEIISRFLLRFRDSLHSLFWHVSLESGGTWVSVFRELRSNLPLLESLCLNHREFEPENVAICSPRFLTIRLCLGHRVECLTWLTSYSGPGMDVVLEFLARSVEH
jgi:hypothetical protein